MNERFKFRFWDKKEKEYFTCGDIDHKSGILKTYPYRTYNWCFEHKNIIAEQCTGLKDKNGKLIYEGDILKITDQMIDYIVEVKWNEGMFCYEITPNSANLVFFDLTDNETTVEVIGNEHENADLLENEE